MKKLQTNKLYILSGVPGSGKSTFLKKLFDNSIYNQEEFVVSTDALRMQIGGHSYGIIEDTVKLSPNEGVNNMMFPIINKILEYRMSQKLTTFFDATNIDDSVRKTYVDIANKHGVEAEILIFNSDSIHQKNFNRKKAVPEYVVDKFLEKFEKESLFAYQNINLNETYELESPFQIDKDIDLIAVGDMHGMKDDYLSAIKKKGFYVENNIIKHSNPKSKLLFLGDVIDRGTDSIELLELVINSVKNENHYFVLGNHEQKLLNIYNAYLNNTPYEVSIGVAETFYDFLKLSEKRKNNILDFIKKAPHYYVQKDRAFLHANIEFFNPMLITKEVALYGSKKENSDDLYINMYSNKENEYPSYKLIRGHIKENKTIDSSIVISLENDAAYGGLIKLYDVKNEKLIIEESQYNMNDRISEQMKIKKSIKTAAQITIQKSGKDKIVKGIMGKSSDNGLYTIYKYSKNVFFDNLWEKHPFLKKARGIVLDKAYNIVQHPFDKIFNYGENSSGLDIPDEQEVIFVEKMNGFLGNITLGHDNELLCTTTGSFDSDFVDYIKDFVDSKTNGLLRRYFAQNNMTLMFEVIHPEDPHIIKYEDSEMGLYLIGARGKEYNAPLLHESELDKIADELKIKRPAWGTKTFGELKDTVSKSNLEGFMVRSNDEFQETLLKFKTPYYLITKFIGRMSVKNISFMYGNPNKFKEKIDEEFYDIVDYIVENYEKDNFNNMDNEEKITIIRTAIDSLRSEIDSSNIDNDMEFDR